MKRDWTPPADIDAERSLISTLCQPGNEVQAFDLFSHMVEQDFTVPAHRALYRAAMGVLDRNGELNSLELKAECDKQGSLVTVNGYTGIVEVLQGDEVGNPAYLAEVIQTKRKHRQLILMGEKLMQRCIAEEGQPDDVIAEFSAGLADVASRNSRRSSIPLSEIVIEAQHGHPFSPQGHSAKAGVFGIEDLDQIAYIPIGEPTLIAARPGVGKTALAVQSAFRSAAMGAKVLFVSMELTEERLKARFAAFLTGVPAKVWLDGTYTHDQANLLAQHQQTLDNIRVISPDQGIPWPTLEAEIRLNIHKHQTNLVFIDYFGFIGVTKQKDENMAYGYARVMASITALCKNAQIGVVVLCQLTKDATNRGSKKPTLTELADTDRPARDAALTLMLYQLQDGTQTWISIAKNRSGRTDYDKMVDFQGATNRFEPIVRYTD
jgi:replicative DNA helicase